MRMRVAFLLAVAAGWAGFSIAAAGDDKMQRYGIDADPKTYPQGTAKETLASLLKAIEDKRLDYSLAQLADPQWVDERVKGLGGKFEDFVKECQETKLDPSAIKQLRKFLDDGEWKVEEKTAEARVKDVPDRSVRFFKIGDRWFMENSYRPPKPKPEESEEALRRKKVEAQLYEDALKALDQSKKRP